MITTGRIKAIPDELMDEEILKPQFEYEVEYLLKWYVEIEKVLLAEYKRMGYISDSESKKIASTLNKIAQNGLFANNATNMSDIAFAIEEQIQENIEDNSYAWHVDRSRNDFQSCAQVMFGREQVLEIADKLLQLADIVYKLAVKTTDIPMPGYTHYQAAQIISPGFYLSALYEQLINSSKRMLEVYDSINKCPLGAGAMAGQELEWDRERMAELLGFSSPQRHALVSVASREWVIGISGELSALSATLSRFVSDLMMWGSGEYRFIELPDQLAGISSAMPQKKNYPILERIRGRTAHITSFHIDFLMAQRSTAFTNLVEVSKEAGKYVITMFKEMKSIFKLLSLVIENLTFNEKRMMMVCKREYLGGFTLANLLTLNSKIPYRKAQIIAGQYIKRSIDQDIHSEEANLELLEEVCKEEGYSHKLTHDAFKDALSTLSNLHSKQSLGSTSPKKVKELLHDQYNDFEQIYCNWNQRKKSISEALEKLQLQL
ncbi:MAG: argininosuccinate lyase [Firmicutes bacterium]|nr:argininosuccinate lyase [Bacillota bacterium]